MAGVVAPTVLLGGQEAMHQSELADYEDSGTEPDCPWRDKETLKYLYHDKQLGCSRIARRLGCSRATVHQWLTEYEIETRSEPQDTAHDLLRDKEYLYELYYGSGYDQCEIAAFLDVNQSSVSRWMGRHGIRPSEEKWRRNNALSRSSAYALHYVNDGYAEWQAGNLEGDKYTVGVHRLLAVAEFGIEAVKDKIVHHKNGIPFDNRHENICLMTASEHAMHHQDIRWGNEDPMWKEDPQYQPQCPDEGA